MTICFRIIAREVGFTRQILTKETLIKRYRACVVELRLGSVNAAKVNVGSGTIAVRIVIEGIWTILEGVRYVGKVGFGRGT